MLAFCNGSTTLARLLERNFGSTSCFTALVDSVRGSTLDDEHFNIVKSGWGWCLWFSLLTRQKVQDLKSTAYGLRSLIGKHVMHGLQTFDLYEINCKARENVISERTGREEEEMMG